MMQPTKRNRSLIIFLFMCIALFWVLPLIFMILNSLKSFQEVTVNTLSFPKSLYFGNYEEVWVKANYFTLFSNTLLITLVSLVGIVITSSMAGYFLARMKRYGNIIIFIFGIGIIVPFQGIMIPLIQTINDFGLIDSKLVLIFVYIAQLSPMAIFLYYAQVKSVPLSLEEMAQIDGAGPIRIFFKIVFPQLRSITATVVVLNSLWIWNDFLLPLLIIQSDRNKTLALGTYALFTGQYATKANLSMTAIFMASIPMIILYFSAQKYIIGGVTAGAVKE